MTRMASHLAWFAVAVLGAFALGTVALSRGEAINALWIVVAAVAIYLVAYRYYSLFIATKVMGLDAKKSHARRPQQRWPGLRPHQQAHPLRPPLRRHRRRRSAGRSRACRPDGLSARHPLADRRGGLRRRGAGFRGAVPLHPPQRSLPGRHGARGDGAHPRHHRPVRLLPDHDHHPRGAGADRGQGPGRESLGHVHGDRHPADRHVHGRLHEIHPPRSHRRDLAGRRGAAAGLHLGRWRGRRRSGVGSGLHLHRRADHLDADRLRLRRRGAADLAGAGAA